MTSGYGNVAYGGGMYGGDPPASSEPGVTVWLTASPLVSLRAQPVWGPCSASPMVQDQISSQPDYSLTLTASPLSDTIRAQVTPGR